MDVLVCSDLLLVHTNVQQAFAFHLCIHVDHELACHFLEAQQLIELTGSDHEAIGIKVLA